MKKSEEFRKLIEDSNSIIITSHISPDPDAVSSVLLLGTSLKKNFPGKQIEMVLEEKPARDLGFLTAYHEIKFQPIEAVVKDTKPDLFVIVDAMNLERLSRKNAEAIRKLIKDNGTKLAIIDHHEEVDVEPNDLYINQKNPATTQELYETLFVDLKLEKPDGYAVTTLLGILTDTARHKYFNPRHRQTYSLVSDLIDAGASVEKLDNLLEQFNEDQLEVVAHMLGNLKSGNGFSYTYVSDDFINQWLEKNKSVEDLKNGEEEFTNRYLRNLEGRPWGFTVFRDVTSGEQNQYGVSFRALSGTEDVSKLANKLGGGGHKPAAGAKIRADNVQAAADKVLAVIEASE